MMSSVMFISEKLWEKVKPLIPPRLKQKGPGGRPPIDQKRIFSGIIYVLRTGCQWKEVPRIYAAGSTIHLHFITWCRAGVFERLWQEGLAEYDELKGIEWRWQAADGAMTKAPLGGEQTGPNPTDRGKKGVKRSLFVDGRGVPLSIVVAGANVNDHLLFENTLKQVTIDR